MCTISVLSCILLYSFNSLIFFFFFFFKQKTAYEISACLVGSERLREGASSLSRASDRRAVRRGGVSFRLPFLSAKLGDQFPKHLSRIVKARPDRRAWNVLNG